MSRKIKSAESAAPTAEELASFEMNDLGNARRLIRLAGGQWPDKFGDPDVSDVRLLYLKGYGWVGYNGRYWDRERGDEIARRLAHQVAVSLQSRAVSDQFVMQRTKSDTKIIEFAEKTGQAGASSAMLKQAESYLAVSIDAFDQHKLAINCANGTLWLTDSDGNFRPKLKSHQPRDRITRCTDLVYDKDAPCPEFLGALNDALPEDDKRECFQRVMGYSSTGCTHEQAIFFLQGLGQDGKSTLMNSCRFTLGSYGGVGDVKTFLDIGQQTASSASPDIAKLAGDTRLAQLSEPPRDARLDEGLVKAWTGGDPVQARELREKPFVFEPIAKLFIICNALPVTKGNDEGIWRRYIPFEFTHQVPDHKMDRQLLNRIKAHELPGILNWLVEGVGKWLDQGINPPDCVLKVRRAYRAQSSPFIEWLNERCVHGPAAIGEATSATALHNDFKSWSEDQGHEKIMTMTGFGRALGDRQIWKSKRNGNIVRLNIRLKTSAELTKDGVTQAAAQQASSASATTSLPEPYVPPPEPDDIEGLFDDPHKDW